MRRVTVPTGVDGSHAIGVDLGGTKILAGVVARDGSGRPAARAGDAAGFPGISRRASSKRRSRAARRRGRRSVSARRRRSTSGRGRRRRVRQPPARNFAAPRHMASASASRSGSTTTRTPPRSASGGGRGTGRRRPRDAHARDGRRRRGHLGRRPVPRPARQGRRARPRRARPRRMSLPGRSPATASSSPTCTGLAATLGARGVRAVGGRAPPGAARGRGRHEGEGDPRRSREGNPGSGIGTFVNIFAPELILSAAASASPPRTISPGPAEKIVLPRGARADARPGAPARPSSAPPPA